MKVQTKKTLLETRKQKRKEKRSEKRQSQFLSWVQHKKNKQNQNASSDLPPPRKQAVEKMIEKRITIPNTFVSEPETVQKEKKKIPKKIPKKTKFQEFLEMEAHKDMDDLEIERNLAKKLKVKGGKLGGFDDGMNELFDGIPSVLNTNDSDDETALLEINEKNINLGSSRKKRKRKQCTAAELADDEFSIDASNREIKTPVEVTKNCIVTNEMTPDPKSAVTVSKYVAPHLRACTQNESQELSSIRRRIRGLLNRLSESNVESITGEVASIFRAIARRDACQIMCDEVLSSCSNGPRGNEQYAAVFAAFVAGLACLVGSDFSAKLIASLAVVYKNEYDKEDNLSLRNLTLLLCQLYIFGVCSSDLIYDFLSVLSKQMTELDVSTILAVLQCCGIKLRTDDPAAMKDLILSVQSRVAQMKLPSTEGGIPKINNKRMEFMLETICDIKNNKKRQKDDPPNHMRMKKWLQKLKAEDILLRGLKWDKLLDPNKKGQWWLSRDDVPVQETLKEVATTIDKEVLEAQKWMQLAAAQRMNTDVRRAIFCVIMSAEDYLDAFEKILRLDLSGKQDREIMRVLVECCLQEKVFNKYYTVLASKLCTHEKNHKFSLQYCLWDHFKELESMEPIRSLNLAKFVAEMICSFTLSLAVLKAVDLTDLKQMTAKKIMHFRIIFENIFEKTDAQVWNIFSRVATIPDHEVLSQSLEFFIKKFVIKGDSQDSSAVKFKLAKKGLNNVAGVLM